MPWNPWYEKASHCDCACWHGAGHWVEGFSGADDRRGELFGERGIAGCAWVRGMGDNRYGDSQLGGLVGRCGPQDRLAAALHDRGCEHNAIRSIGKRWDRGLRGWRRARRQVEGGDGAVARADQPTGSRMRTRSEWKWAAAVPALRC
jgi:hypothetical protein